MSFTHKSLAGPRHIVASVQTANAMLYKVPNGKTFKGTLYLNGSASISINGGSTVSFGTTPTVLTDFVLGPGMFIRSVAANAIMLLGVEA